MRRSRQREKRPGHVFVGGPCDGETVKIAGPAPTWAPFPINHAWTRFAIYKLGRGRRYTYQGERSL